MSVSKGLFVAYRVLAMVVGVLLAFCALIVFPARHFATEGSSLQQWGERWTTQHGYRWVHSCGADLELVHTCEACGEPVTGHDLHVRRDAPVEA